MSVAVAVPIHRRELTPDEALSLRHLQTHLAGHDLYFVVPEGLQAPLDLATKRFDPVYFQSYRAHQRLLVSSRFYKAFLDYEYVLVHHVDSIVFSDLGDWSERGYDYVGAPWVRLDGAGRPFFAGVGNGGFSLRRVESCLRVLEQASTRVARLGLRAGHAARLVLRAARHVPRTLDPRDLARSLVGGWRAGSFVYEDKFWSLDAPRLLPGFAIPSAEVAMAFAFETEPRFCLARNGGRLPVGCHRWALNDRALWEPHLLAPAV